MAKYDDELKLKVINAYLKGEGGYFALAKQFNIAHRSIVQRWVRTYKKIGIDGICRKKKYAEYPMQLKLDVINYSLRTGESAQEVANHYGIHNSTMVTSWLLAWKKKGLAAFSNKKGRSSLTDKSRKQINNKNLTREQELEKENELLRAELAFIKKLKALGMPIPTTLRSNTLELLRNSEKSSN
jgi:transposase